MYDKSLHFRKGECLVWPDLIRAPSVSLSQKLLAEMFTGGSLWAAVPQRVKRDLVSSFPLTFLIFLTLIIVPNLSHWFCLSYFLSTLIVCSYLHCVHCARLLISSLYPFQFVFYIVPKELLQTLTQTIPLSFHLTCWHQSQGHTLLHMTSFLLLPIQPQCTVCRSQSLPFRVNLGVCTDMSPA